MRFPFTREVVERVLKDQGYDDVMGIKDRYVGRGQDKYCIAFVAPEVRNVVQFLLELSGETEAEGVELEDLVAMAGTMCSDSYGHDVIVYFPKYAEFEKSAELVEDEEPDMSAASSYLGKLVR